MISSWKCFFIIMKILLVTANQNHEATTRPSYLVNTTDVCNLPPDIGSCSRYYHRWYYDSSKNECDLFVYSGCGGNDNRFDFFNDCHKLCIKKADVTTRNDLPPTNDPTNYTIYLKTGTEEKASPEWKNSSRDENTGVTAVDDVPSTSAKKGYIRRSDRKVKTTDTSRNTNADVCNLLPDRRVCSGYYFRWYYNSSKNECHLFVYRGCGGSGNRFDFFNDCSNLCIKKADVTTRNDLQPTRDPTNYTIYLKTGREAKASPDWRNWSWDENTGVTVDDVPPTSVKTGYTRRFNPDKEVETTTDARKDTNVDICSQPQEPGHCYRNYVLLRWYYDSSNNTCKMFLYSGCGGNDNSFDDFQGCAQVCIKETVRDICNQPKDSGFCLRGHYYHLWWYYDNSTNSCKLFYYSGCGGNDNRFYRLQACQQQCVRDETTTDFLYPTDSQMRTSDYIYPGIRTEDWMSSTGTVGWTDWKEETRVVIDVPTSYENRAWTRNHIVGYALVSVFVFAAMIFIRMAIARCQCAEQVQQLLSSNDEAGRTSSSDDNLSPLRVSVCVISLRNEEQQSSDESTAGYEMSKSDQNYSDAPPAYYPPHPPPYIP